MMLRPRETAAVVQWCTVVLALAPAVLAPLLLTAPVPTIPFLPFAPRPPHACPATDLEEGEGQRAARTHGLEADGGGGGVGQGRKDRVGIHPVAAGKSRAERLWLGLWLGVGQVRGTVMHASPRGHWEPRCAMRQHTR